MGFAAALAGEDDVPAGAGDAGDGEVGGRHAADPPSSHRRGGEGKRVGAGPARAQQHQRHRPALLGGKLEPAGRGHAGTAHLADDGGKAAVPKPFLHHRQHLFVAAAFGIQEPVGRKPGLGQRRREEVMAGKRPKHGSALPGARGDTRGEQAGGGIVGKAGAGTGAFVKRRKRQSAAVEATVDIFYAKGKMAGFAPASRFNCTDHRAQRGNALDPC